MRPLRDEDKCTHGDGRVLVQLVFGGDAEASVVAAGGPGQSHRRLQLLVHLLVDGAAELRAVVPEGKRLVRGFDSCFSDADVT